MTGYRYSNSMTFEDMTMKSKGFTLPELIVTMAIAGILLAVAVPTFQQTMRVNKLVGDTNRIVGLMNFTKSTAITRNTVVSICAGSNGVCNNNWNDGIIVFVDTNGNCVVDPAQRDTIVRVPEGLLKDHRVSGASCISFTALGVIFSQQSPQSQQQRQQLSQTISICNPNLTTENIRDIVIEFVGRYSVIHRTGNC